MRTDNYTEIFQDTTAVEKYEHVVYAPDSYSSAVNRRQRAFLRALVKREFPYRRPVQHDFACGTGRAIKLLQGLVRSAHGYDTSPAMLAKAGEVTGNTHLHLVEPDGPVPDPAAVDGPAVVTVFRLLLNAGPGVRERAVQFAAEVLPDANAGLLVIENHGNRHSLRHLRHRHKVDQPWYAELSHDEVTELLARYGFTVVRQRGFALFPQGWYGRRWLRPVVSLLDDVCGRFGVLSRYAVTVLYVARRTAATSLPAPTSVPAATTAPTPAHPEEMR